MNADHQNWEHLIDLAGALSQQNDFQEILRVVAQQAMSLLYAETALILMINPRTRHTVKTVVREGQSATTADSKPCRIKSAAG